MEMPINKENHEGWVVTDESWVHPEYCGRYGNNLVTTYTCTGCGVTKTETGVSTGNGVPCWDNDDNGEYDCCGRIYDEAKYYAWLHGENVQPAEPDVVETETPEVPAAPEATE
ncbi:MAG: hypothetical protein NC432_14005 [Roseburia sp.]|nr:hypothetical protein [Roseburia sp.]MCM1099635.1 hypothetical protein [Ruminococcus flavefaciens]